MRYQDLIKRAWIITQEHKYLRSFGTMTSIFFILIGVLRTRYVLPTPFGTMRDIHGLLDQWSDRPELWLAVYIGAIGLIYVFFFFTHILAEGGLIASIAKIEKRGMTLSFSKTFALGIHYFLPLVEFRALTSVFDVTRYIVILLFIRFYGRSYHFYESTVFYGDKWFFVLIGIFIAIMSFFLIYAEYDLVIRKSGMIKCIRKSMTLVTFHFRETLLMTIIVGLVTMRAIINLALVFLIPIAVFYLVSFITSHVSLAVALAIGGTVAILLFWLSARIAGVLLVFTTAVWTLTYLHLDDQKEYKILEDEDEEDHKDETPYEDPGMI